MKSLRVLLLSVLLCAGLAAPALAGWQDWLKKADEALGSSGSSAVSSSSLSNADLIEGLKEALAVGAKRAVELLGQKGGYLDDAQVRIPLPDTLDSVASGLRKLGQGDLVDEFEETMNRAAEQAVPKTIDIFQDTISAMSLQDARGIYEGPDDAATQYFRDKSGDRLSAAILPIVQQATAKVGVTSAYKQMLAKAGFLSNLVDTSSLDLDRYVTEKALDGLFLKLAAEEKAIREDPVARTTDILKKVFGSN